VPSPIWRSVAMQIFEILHAEVYILVSLFCLSNIGAAVFFIGERLPLTIDASGGKCVLILVAKISTYGKCVQVMVTNITRIVPYMGYKTALFL